MSENAKSVNKAYIKMVLVPIKMIPEGCKALKALAEKGALESPENVSKLAKACDNAGNGKALAASFCKGQLGMSISDGIKLYESVSPLPEPVEGIETLALEIAVTYRENLRTEMGFLPKADGDGYYHNPNIFARYFLERVKLVLLGDMWALYNRSGYYEIVDDTMVEKLVRNMLNSGVKDYWRSSTSSECMKALRLETRQVAELNPHREFLNLRNGMLNVDTGELLPHSPEHLSTVRIPYTYDPEAECKRFRQFIEEITEGDPQLAALLQEIVGYLVTSETRAEKSFLLYGSGSNGKSVLANVIRVLVGEDNVSNISLEKFSQQFGLQPIIGKSVNISSENELTRRFNTENLKAIVSGDRVSISVKHQNDVPYTPICKLLFLVNSLPDTTDTTDGFYRKILIVPFKHKFTDEEKDVHLFEKLKSEMSGILNWALEGLKRLKENDFRFSQCDAADHALADYREEQNAVPRFFTDCVRREDGVWVAKSAVLSAYKNWLTRNGMDDPCRGSNQRFWREYELASEQSGIPYVVKKIKGVRYIDGVKLAEEAVTNNGGIDFEE